MCVGSVAPRRRVTEAVAHAWRTCPAVHFGHVSTADRAVGDGSTWIGPMGLEAEEEMTMSVIRRLTRRSFLATAVSAPWAWRCSPPAASRRRRPRRSRSTPRTVDAKRAEAAKPGRPASAALPQLRRRGRRREAGRGRQGAAAPAAVLKTYLLSTVPANLSEAPPWLSWSRPASCRRSRSAYGRAAVVDRKGKYGGILRSATNAKELFPWTPIKYAGGMHGIPLRLGPDLVKLGAERPQERRDVGRQEGAYRHDAEGAEAFDGHPHTADDWMFWYDNVFMDKDVLLAPPTPYARGSTSAAPR